MDYIEFRIRQNKRRCKYTLRQCKRKIARIKAKYNL